MPCPHVVCLGVDQDGNIDFAVTICDEGNLMHCETVVIRRLEDSNSDIDGEPKEDRFEDIPLTERNDREGGDHRDRDEESLMDEATTLREYFTRLAHSWFGEVRSLR